MKNISSLCSLNIGDTALVDTLNVEGAVRRRFLDIGLYEGTRVECVGRSPSGDPIALLIRGAVIAIRKADCERILVREVFKA